MFIRLQPGVYSFGSKKVCIKVENGKIIIRVGGGYLRINEFLEQYTTQELDRSIRDGIDPMTGTSSPAKPAPSSPSKRNLVNNINTLGGLMPTSYQPITVNNQNSPCVSPRKGFDTIASGNQGN
jgi:hypothetical protein